MPHMGEATRRKQAGAENTHDMKQQRKADNLLDRRARFAKHGETALQRSIRAMNFYLSGNGTPEWREMVAAHYAQVHPEHTSRVVNCALCEISHMQTTVEEDKLRGSLGQLAVVP
jgi:hypothetical protein